MVFEASQDWEGLFSSFLSFPKVGNSCLGYFQGFPMLGRAVFLLFRGFPTLGKVVFVISEASQSWDVLIGSFPAHTEPATIQFRV